MLHNLECCAARLVWMPLLTYLLDLCVYPTFQRHGNGTLKFPNGSVYVGDFRQNTITGHGVMTYWNGDCYEGEWKHGLVRWEWDTKSIS